MTALPHGSTIGILGGGQLGRMLSVAAGRLGYKAHIFEPGAAPAGDLAAKVTQAEYTDLDAMREFARSVDAVTFEFENVPASALDAIDTICPIRPGRNALAVSQDRLDEKTFLNGLGLRTAPFATVDTVDDLKDVIGTPAILKTRRMGYDGKGQVRVNADTDLDAAFAELNGASAILEGFVPFLTEVSLIAARGVDGQVACYDPGENVHSDGILRTTTVPATLPARRRTDAVLLAANILNALEYVGVLGVELFVTADALIVNEIAPRVHNSGHWTQNGTSVDQFEQHIRAISGLPLGDGSRYADVVMQNLIGDDMDQLPDLITQPNTAVHLYGKSDTRPGRKMGHVNIVSKLG
jgi:5-(carboxyamino)imidazole ribonucleotide synthase